MRRLFALGRGEDEFVRQGTDKFARVHAVQVVYETVVIPYPHFVGKERDGEETGAGFGAVFGGKPCRGGGTVVPVGDIGFILGGKRFGYQADVGRIVDNPQAVAHFVVGDDRQIRRFLFRDTL